MTWKRVVTAVVLILFVVPLVLWGSTTPVSYTHLTLPTICSV